MGWHKLLASVLRCNKCAVKHVHVSASGAGLAQAQSCQGWHLVSRLCSGPVQGFLWAGRRQKGGWNPARGRGRAFLWAGRPSKGEEPGSGCYSRANPPSLGRSDLCLLNNGPRSRQPHRGAWRLPQGKETSIPLPCGGPAVFHCSSAD